MLHSGLNCWVKTLRQGGVCFVTVNIVSLCKKARLYFPMLRGSIKFDILNL